MAVETSSLKSMSHALQNLSRNDDPSFPIKMHIFPIESLQRHNRSSSTKQAFSDIHFTPHK
jgi:hypothetical protein